MQASHVASIFQYSDILALLNTSHASPVYDLTAADWRNNLDSLS